MNRIRQTEDMVVSVALEAATLMTTVRFGTTAREIADLIARAGVAAGAASLQIEKLWMTATASALATAALIATARPDFDPEGQAKLDAHLSDLAERQMAVVIAIRKARAEA